MVLPLAPEPLDWWRISQLGERVKLVDELEVAPEETTAYYFIAKTPRGMRGNRIVVEVLAALPTAEQFICSPPKYILDKMETKPHIGWIGHHVRPTYMYEVIASQITNRVSLKTGTSMVFPSGSSYDKYYSKS